MHKTISGYLFCCTLSLATAAAGQEHPYGELERAICELQATPVENAELNLKAVDLIRELAQQGTEANGATPYLLAALQITADNVRGAAAEALGSVCAEPVHTFPDLIIAAYEGPRNCRSSTPFSLMDVTGRKLGDDVLIEFLKHTDWRVRCWAVRHINERIRDRERAALEAIRTVKRSGGGGPVVYPRPMEPQREQEAVAIVAGQLTRQLITCIKDEDPDVRAFAAEGLSHSWAARFHGLEHVIPLFGDVAKLRYTLGVQDPGKPVRDAAVLAACRLRERLAPPELLYESLGNPDTNVREGVLSALFARPENDERWKSVLVAALRDPDDRVFRMALTGSSHGSLDNDAVWEELTLALIESLENEKRILEACSRLGSMSGGAQAALPALKNLLVAKNCTVRIGAANAIWKIAKQADIVLPVYIELLPTEIGRRAACKGLAEMREEAAAAVPLLIGVLGTGSAKDLCVIDVLGQIGPAANAALPQLDAIAAVARVPINLRAKDAADRIRSLQAKGK